MDLSIRNNIDLASSSLGDAKSAGLTESAKKMASDRQEIHKLAEEFESVFLEIVLKSMRNSVGKSGLTDGGNGEDIFQGMLDSEYAKDMASQRNTGISDSIEKQLLSIMDQQAQAMAVQAGQKAYGAQGLQDATKQAKIESGGISKDTPAIKLPR